MRKKIILTGQLCDVCGCIIDPHFNESVYFNGQTYNVCEKNLSVSLMSPSSQRHNKMYGFYNIAKQKDLICGRCAYKFNEMYASWKKECQDSGKAQRERLERQLELMRNEND